MNQIKSTTKNFKKVVLKIDLCLFHNKNDTNEFSRKLLLFYLEFFFPFCWNIYLEFSFAFDIKYTKNQKRQEN